jgi:hypothetical protein
LQELQWELLSLLEEALLPVRYGFISVKTQAANKPPITGPITGIHE